MRKGLIPIVGAAREPGTSMLIEDVACPVDKLADMMIDLVDMFQVRVCCGWVVVGVVVGVVVVVVRGGVV